MSSPDESPSARERTQEGAQGPLHPPQFDDSAFLDSMSLSVVCVEVLGRDGRPEAHGTAFFVGPERVATCWHVVVHASGAQVRFASGQTFRIDGLLWKDPEQDIAVLAVKTPGIHPVPLSLRSKVPSPGELLAVVGPPLPGDPHCVASYGRALPPSEDANIAKEGIRVRIPMAPGWSGSPVLSAEGEVLGIARASLEGTYSLLSPVHHLGEALSSLGDRAPEALQGISPRGPFGRGPHGDSDTGSLPDNLVRAVAAYARGDLDGAEAEVRKVLEASPADGYAWEFLGCLLQKRGKAAESIEALSRACEIRPGSAEFRAMLGSALLEAGRTREAVAALGEAVKLDAGDPDTHYSLAYGLAKLGRHSEAIVEYRRVLALDPTYAAAKQGIDYSQSQLEGGR